MCTLPGQKSLANISWRGSAKFPKTYDLLAKIAYGKMAVYSAFVRRKTESTRSRKATPTPLAATPTSCELPMPESCCFWSCSGKGGRVHWLAPTNPEARGAPTLLDTKRRHHEPYGRICTEGRKRKLLPLARSFLVVPRR